MAKEYTKQTEEPKEDPKPVVEKFPEPEVVCYIAQHPRTLVLVGTTTGPVRQPDGTVIMVPTQKPIKLVFNPVFRATKEFAASHKMELAQLVKLIEGHSQFTYEKEIRRMGANESEPKKKGPALVAGARGTGAF